MLFSNSNNTVFTPLQMNKLSEANRSMALSVRANGAVGGFMLVNSHFQTRVHSTV